MIMCADFIISHVIIGANLGASQVRKATDLG